MRPSWRSEIRSTGGAARSRPGSAFVLGQNLRESPYFVKRVVEWRRSEADYFRFAKSHFTPVASSLRNSSFGCSWTRIDRAVGRALTNSIAKNANISLFQFGLDHFAGRFGSESGRMKP